MTLCSRFVDSRHLTADYWFVQVFSKLFFTYGLTATRPGVGFKVFANPRAVIIDFFVIEYIYMPMCLAI